MGGGGVEEGRGDQSELVGWTREGRGGQSKIGLTRAGLSKTLNTGSRVFPHLCNALRALALVLGKLVYP